MILEYINKAMQHAEYEKLENGDYAGRIPVCPGAVSIRKTLYECQEELHSVLEGWLIVKIRHGDKLPVIGGINLNRMMPSEKKVADG